MHFSISIFHAMIEQTNSSHCFITGVKVIDIEPYGNGGLAKIVNGGPRENHVTINFTSKPGEPMLFRVINTGYCVRNFPPRGNGANSINNNTITYGWNVPSNVSIHNSTMTNHNTTSPWWQFW